MALDEELLASLMHRIVEARFPDELEAIDADPRGTLRQLSRLASSSAAALSPLVSEAGEPNLLIQNLLGCLPALLATYQTAMMLTRKPPKAPAGALEDLKDLWKNKLLERGLREDEAGAIASSFYRDLAAAVRLEA